MHPSVQISLRTLVQKDCILDLPEQGGLLCCVVSVSSPAAAARQVGQEHCVVTGVDSRATLTGLVFLLHRRLAV